MKNALPILACALLIGTMAVAGCSYTPDLYCDEDKPCDDPARPFCDLEGTYPASEGVGHTCIPDPFTLDAGVDAPEADANLSTDADTSTDASTTDAPPATHTLTVVNAGSGNGTVVSSPFGINCGDTCSAVFEEGTSITLTATPESDSDLSDWSGGGCSGTGACEISLSADVTVTATFDLKEYALNVTRGGDGTGGVTSSPGGIDCGSDCTETYAHGTSVTLTAAATGASSFGGWSGDCSSATTTCQVTMDGPKNVGAAFDLNKFTLSVSISGGGAGSVSSTDGLISCPGDCSESYDAGSSVTLTAQYDSAVTTFGGWSGGGCSGTGSTCQVTVDASTQVQATFTKVTHDLTVNKVGSGGLVTSTPAGINCGTDCTGTYDANTSVTLSASYDPTLTVFQGWSGCTGGDTCQVTMNADKAVTATFVPKQYLLEVTLAGSGGGTVTSNVGPIDCPGTCSAYYDVGSVVVLNAADDGTSTFDGWSGGPCTGTGTCQVTINGGTSVTATFTRITYDLTVTKTSTQSGDGLVSSTPSGISCGPGCASDTATFAAQTPVTLTASTVGGSEFLGWTGAGCSGTNDCLITMSSAKLVDAEFCLPDTCETNQCDYISDGCGGSVDCGDCAGEFNTCGGGGTPNVCYTSNTYSVDLEHDSSESAGITDAEQEANGGVLDLTGDFTFEMWAKFESPLPGFPYTWIFISKHLSSGDYRSYRWWFQNLGSSDPDYYIGINISQTGAAEDRVTWPFTPQIGVWYHLAVTCDVSRAVATEFELFVDGVSQGNGHVDSDANVTAILNGPAPFKIGSLAANEWSFDGKVDDVRVWSDVRSASEISTNRNVELSGSESGLVGYWKFNNDYSDSTNHGNDLTPAGTPVFTTDVP